MSETKPCPFCGEKVPLTFTYEIKGEIYGYCVVCDPRNGGCGATGGRRPTVDAAHNAWNRRSEEKEK